MAFWSFWGCFENKQKPTALPFHEPPVWAKEAIWYQIFVERFRNGNPNNNPTLQTCEISLIDSFPDEWSLTPWGHNWYKQESWAKTTDLDFYRTIQMRRYGGDLAGVVEKIPYLKELGITAIYFNPLNDAPSLHKYDARYYHHIDVTFGDDIEGDMKVMASEDPNNPDTWQWTSADKKFLELINKLQNNGIKVVMDYSWNHTGNNFWAFKDILENKENSKYKDWFHFQFLINPTTGETEFQYEGWYGIGTLPELKKINTSGKKAGSPYEGNLQDDVKKHIFDVTKRWMDPKGDGSCQGGINGMRLDVAEHVPVGFWRDYRKYVRSINPEFYLVGENWWYQWPDELMDPAPWVEGDIFDAVMHYQWFKVARGYFAQPEDKLSLDGFRTKLDSVFQKYPAYTQQAMMNVGASHDAPRLLTSFFNKNKYKHHCKPQEDASYKVHLPDEETYHRLKLYLLHQFTFVGAPHIWNGDEMGMIGADDPDCRKPLVWPDIKFDVETPSHFTGYAYEYQPKFDEKMFEYYKSLIQLRKSSKAFVYGSYEFLPLADDKNILAYIREYQKEKYLVVFNNNPKSQDVLLSKTPLKLKVIFNYNNSTLTGMILKMLAFSGVVVRVD